MNKIFSAGTSVCTNCDGVPTTKVLERECSHVISALRFPMALGVVLIHNNWVVNGIQLEVDSGEWEILAFFKMFLPTFFGMAVPLFFFISGYLFFYKTQSWSWQRYGKKLQRRVTSLLIPYLIWNIFSIVGEAQNAYRLGTSLDDFFEGFTLLSILRFFWCSGIYKSTTENWLGVPHVTDYPADIPLWFVRDLMVLVLLAPAIFYVIRNLRHWLLVLVVPVFLFGLCPENVPGFSISSLLFFSLGAFFAIEKLDFLQPAVGGIKWIVPLSLFLLCAVVISEPTEWLLKDVLNRLYVLSAIPATIAVCGFLLRKGCMGWSIALAPTSFFIFASHFVSYIGFLGISRFALIFIFGEPQTEWVAVLLFFVNPLLATALSVLCYKFLVRCLPRLSLVLCGGR
ncbi:MAG: acyltransferase [Bacteroidaceae bacterium]|nr:acyltransferase [Bacteroidaceae bacterium]